MANAQWTQLGPGAGGQERAVFLYNNPYTGLEDLYVGSDVSGVWRAPNINAADISNPLQYDYTYISNNELFRFVNKFVNQPSYPNILFVGNRGGIDIVDMANTNASVQKLWDMPDAWVSDIHVIGTTLGGSHTIFATTGSTRIQDEPNNNKNNTTIADLYEFTWNGSATTVTTAGYQLDGLSGDQDVYCMFVDESPVYDIFLLGTETGLFQFTQTQIASTIYGAQIAGPNNVGTNYKVTSITREGTSDFYLVTLYDQGLWEYNSSTKAWTNNLITHLIGEDENSSNTVTTKDYANDYASYSFTRLLQLNGTNPGWVLLNEEQTYDNHYVGVFYSEDNGSGVPTGNWRVLNTYTGSNDWGWNNAKPCGNINSALITTDNKLLIGKSGNIFITKNPITNITPLNVAWQQIYSRNGVGNNGACADSYKNMGYVNYAAKAVYHDAAGVTWIAQADRLMFYSNQNTDFYQPIDKATNSSCSNVDLSGNFSYPNCVGTLDKNLPLSDCFFITDDQSGDIWAGMGSGFASKKGYGFVVKRNNSNDWKREGDAICGDPQKIFFVGTDKYLLVNEPAGGSARIHKLNGTSWGPPMEFWNGNNEELQDAVVGVNDNMLYVIRKKNPKFEIVRIDLTGPSVKTTNTISNTNQVPLRLAIMPYNTNDYKIIVGCGPKSSTSITNIENLKETYFYTNSSTTYTYNEIDIVPANLSNIFKDLHFDALDNADHGITGICIDKDLGTIYVSTVKKKTNSIAERSHIYRGTYNTSNGNIDNNWTEITGQLPNKAIKFMTCKGNTICNEQIYCCVRGLGAWRWNASALTFTGLQI
nr:hypothetical protein [Bacteroidota bacterium]